MIYSNSNNFLFCHVPKTGGTSLRSKLKYFSRPYEQSKINKLIRRLPFTEESALFYDFYNRPHTTCYKAYLLLGSKYNQLLSFAIIRDPLDWVISSYTHFVQNYKSIQIGTSSIYIKSFEQYIDLLSSVDYGYLPCQHKLIVDNQGSLIVDMLGEFDKISQFSGLIQKLLKLGRFDLPHLNKNLRHKPNQFNMTESTKNKIKNTWNLDFILWETYQEQKESFYGFFDKQSISSPDSSLESYDPWGIFVN